jgi:hypothetical protein
VVAVIATGGDTVRRIATTASLVAVMAVVLAAAVHPPPAGALGSGTREETGSARPAHAGPTPSSPSGDRACPRLDARDAAKLPDSAELRAEIDDVCRTAATMTYADEKPSPFPLWIVVVAAIVVIALGLGLVWYYCIKRDTDIPWFWSGWPWP